MFNVKCVKWINADEFEIAERSDADICFVVSLSVWLQANRRWLPQSGVCVCVCVCVCKSERFEWILNKFCFVPIQYRVCSSTMTPPGKYNYTDVILQQEMFNDFVIRPQRNFVEQKKWTKNIINFMRRRKKRL